MPSLFDPSLSSGNINVAANYGRMVPQHTYGAQGTNYTNFGTRNLRFIKVVVTGADLTVGAGTSNNTFSVAVRALQTVAEVWGVFTPSATGFVAVLSDDTFNDGDGSSNLPGGYAQLEEAVASNLGIVAANVAVSTLAFTGISLA